MENNSNISNNSNESNSSNLKDKKNHIKRRDFLKMMGICSAAIGAGLTLPSVIATTENGVLVKSKDQYGGFLVEQMRNGSYPYKVNLDKLKHMSNKSIVFSRNVWDPAREDRPRENLMELYLVDGKGKVPNQTRLDYAFMAASWALAYTDPLYQWETRSGRILGIQRMAPRPWDPADLDMSWEDASLAVKHAARFYGASLAGVAEMNRLWLYSDCYSPSKEDKARAIPVLSDGERFEQTDDAWYIPESMNRVVALAFEEDYTAIANSPGRVASAGVGNGYSRMAITSHMLAEFIRGLGYRAIPSGNNIGLSIPIAIDAGLGELGRQGLLITPKYGPRVRLAKVITDMPLVPDSPIKFGVTEFCEACMLCADHCPSKSVTKGPQTWEGKSPSNNPGVYKWFTHPESCFDFNGFSCSNCKRVCPFNKPNNSWLHKMIRQIIKSKFKILDKVMVTFDQASGYGQEVSSEEFWKMNGDKTITGREEM